MPSSPVCLPQGACSCKKTVAFSYGKQYLESGNFHQKIQARTCVRISLYSVNPHSEFRLGEILVTHWLGEKTAMRWEVMRLEEQIAQVEKRLEWAVERDDEALQDKLEEQLEALENRLAHLQGERIADATTESGEAAAPETEE
ncbi:hypothetical protein [Pokkaliibacter plantistimulans]|nr:hypothetical protein [Pokkaliibacter plantistimulans]